VSGRKSKKRKGPNSKAWYDSGWVSGLLLVSVAIYLGLSLFGGVGPWWRLVTGGESVDLVVRGNPGGPVGSYLSALLHSAFGGIWCWAFPVFLLVTGLAFLFGRTNVLRPWILRAIPLWLITTSWIAQPGFLLSPENGARYGGVVGFYVARGFKSLFGPWGSPIFLTLLLVIVVTLIFKPWLGWLFPLLAAVARGFGSGLRGVGRLLMMPVHALHDAYQGVVEWNTRRQIRRAEKKAARDLEKADRQAAQRREEDHPAETIVESAVRKERRHHVPPVSETVTEPLVTPPPESEELALPGAAGAFMGEGEAPGPSGESETARTAIKKKPKKARGPVTLPGIGLLTPGDPDNSTISTAEMDSSADLLESTLRSFGVEGEVKDVRPGPVVTTFEFQPGHGIRVNQIVQRSDDLALAMRARSIRMEAPIPGKAAVGIEIPNDVAKMVRLREVVELLSSAKRNPLQVVLGKDVVGRPVSIDIAALPHLLVAGSTGSGKSVCLNAMICNLLMNNDPSTLRMVMIDPKMLEMNVYNGIPHLLLPVVTDPKESLKALQWMVAQMEYRYRKLAKCSVRNIQQYNDKVAQGLVKDDDGELVTEPMPYFLTIVDELADLMLQLGKDLEDLITRLAQKARAVGIHLILATQRPSVDVLTGVIKANIPCRIAFRVIQMNDSRTILDMKGAEKLLGHGDMLYLQPGRALPVRVHGSFIDVDECEAITRHWLQYSGTTDEISLNEKPEGGIMHTGEDDLYEDAMRIVVQHQSGSTSLLQRRLRVGYTRAGRLMDMLEESGVVGPFTGSKARDVLIGPEDLPGEREGEG
jgi:DNA segregation ATPase FtsK/SpoIIIE, S-DNA-T family